MIGIVTFADNRFKGSLERFKIQANRIGFFDHISINSEGDLSPDYRERHRDRLNRNCRGFGYWCWKPFFVLHELNHNPDLEILIYCDAGCHIWRGGANVCKSMFLPCGNPNMRYLVFRCLSTLKSIGQRAICSSTIESRWDIPMHCLDRSVARYGWSRTRK